MIPLTFFAGQSIAVFGLGGSGRVSARALMAGGGQVFAWDDTAAAREMAAREGIALCDLSKADWSRFDALVLAPGVPLTHPKPHWSVERAVENNCEIIGDIELFCRQRAFQCPDSPFVAITGTNGKSTTTALVSHLLEQLGCDVQMGGNIGKAILSLEPASPSRVHVIEVSSYQIDLAPSLDPTVGVLLNLSPDHLDRHGTMEHYAQVKEQLIRSSLKKVIGLDDAWTRAIAGRIEEDSGFYPFTNGEGAGFVPRLYAIGSTLFLHESKGSVSSSCEIASLDGAVSLRGKHNVQNALAALGVIRALQDWRDETLPCGGGRYDKNALAESSLGRFETLWELACLQEGLIHFPGLSHRLELVGEAGGVIFVNDSKATNVSSAKTALEAWQSGIFWIAGGLAKDGGIEELVSSFGAVEKAYLIGDAASDFAKTLEGRVCYVESGTLEAAVEQAFKDAKSFAESGSRAGEQPVVLLSPACASFDQFANFEKRGEVFCDLVAKIPGVRLRGRER